MSVFTDAVGAEPVVRATSDAPRWEFSTVRFETAGSGVTAVEGAGEFRGVVKVVRGPSGLAVVNDIAFDDYLRGIVEVPATWPPAALEAQVVAARSYALWQMWTPSTSEWRAVGADICASEACQVYEGVAGDRRPGSDQWSNAVEASAGKVLLREGGVIKSMYSSSNGGEVRGGWVHGQPDPDDARVSPYRQWRSVLPAPDLLAVVEAAPDSRLVDAVNDGINVRLSTETPDRQRSDHVLPIADFRDVVNEAVPPTAGLPRPLPSPYFTLTLTDEGVVAEGAGNGHGIGLSQYGALGKAQVGMPADDILAWYYGIAPTFVDPASLPQRINVAVDDSAPEAVIDAAEPMTITDGRGNLVAPNVTGRWRVVPHEDGVRLIPPDEHAAPLTSGVRSLTTTPAPVGQPVEVEVQLSLPAVVDIEVESADGSTTRLPRRQAGPGELIEQIPLPRQPGTHRVTVSLDAGGGRVSDLQLDLATVDPDAVAHTEIAADEVSSGGGGGGDEADVPWNAAAPALALVTGTSLAAVFVGRRFRVRAHP